MRMLSVVFALVCFAWSAEAIAVASTLELSLALQSGEPIEVTEHLTFTGKERLIFTSTAVNVAIWGNCRTSVPPAARAQVLIGVRRVVPHRACAITFVDGGFEFESINSLPNAGYRRLLLSNLVFSSHAPTPGYGIQATKMVLWMSGVEWSGFSNLAVYDGAAYISDVAFADNHLALNVGMGNRENSTAPFVRKTVLSQVTFHHNNAALVVSDYTEKSAVTLVANNVTLSNNPVNVNFDLVLNVNLTLVVAGELPYAVPAPDASGPYRIQPSDLNLETPGTVAQPGIDEFTWLTSLQKAGVAGISRLINPFGPVLYTEQPLPPELTNTDDFIYDPPPPYVAPPPAPQLDQPAITPNQPGIANKTDSSNARGALSALGGVIALLAVAAQL